ncbi:hypothetical protein SAMD00019534_065970 [Acytostelium subglobosum LB1]|uniref:hypothetical protein n=1 Tax=Acytostelium subglobosum LB1 TaxID=1410327 RepID=UPI000644F92C|nr:hypothetical protein SAMD00019534_065970 [Acytostelium subglobosum LB1]GAM23422.1 hypothetical protein SAMD00019534_065970 [Acytostelium subglobosum LB1]|eukprot:XP_012753871.1 hypothetical protein SAMD00019534_065970 [Acytostelium subglobosum LB1]
MLKIQSFIVQHGSSCRGIARATSTSHFLTSISSSSHLRAATFASKKPNKDTFGKQEVIETPSLLTISSYYRYPEFGVNNYVNLTRETVLMVKKPSDSLFNSTTKAVYGVGCAHVTHPFLYPYLYSEDRHQLLLALGESNIKTQLEYRDQKTGRVLQTVPLHRPFYLHPTLDLVCFKMNIDDLLKSNLPFKPSILELEKYEEPRKGHTGKLFGYQMISDKDDIMTPVESEYRFNVAEPANHFVQTKSVMAPSIRGGPAVNFDNEVVGMIVAMVKLDPKAIEEHEDENRRIFLNSLNSNTVYLPSEVINQFISEIDSS